MPFRSIWFDDWDGIQFALALEKINLALNLPHPPGYIAYVFTGRLVDLLFNDPQFSLSFLSIITGSLSIVLIYHIAKNLAGREAAFIAAILLFLIPTRMQMSIVAMSDVPALALFLGSISLAIEAKRRKMLSWLLLLMSGLVLGWCIGTRPQWIFQGVAFSLLLLVKNKKKGSFIFGGLVGTFAWLVPASIIHGTFADYLRLSQRQYELHPTDRAKFNWESSVDFVGLTAHRWELLLVVSSIAAIAAIVLRPKVIFDSGKWPLKQAMLFIFLWFGLACFTSLLFHPIYLHRITIPVVAPLSLLIAIPLGVAFNSLSSKRHKILIGVLAFFFTAIQTQETFSLAREIRSTIPPPIQGVHKIAAQLESGSTYLLSNSNERFWSWYLPKYRVDGFRDPVEHIKSNSLSGYKHLVLSKPLNGSRPTDTWKFERSYDTYFVHDRVNLYHYKLDAVDFLFEKGFYEREDWGRWMQPSASGYLRANQYDDKELHLTLHSGLNVPRVLELKVDGENVWSKQIGVEKESHRIPLPLTRDWSTFTLSTPNPVSSPKELGHSDDTRKLAFGIENFRIGFPRFTIGTEFDLSNPPADPSSVLTAGWADVEGWGIWSDSKEAHINLLLNEIPSSDLELHLEGRYFLGSAQDDLDVIVRANGTIVYQGSIREGIEQNPSFLLPQSVFKRDANLNLVFQFEKLDAPKDFGGTDDDRLLGISISKFRLGYASDTNHISFAEELSLRNQYRHAIGSLFDFAEPPLSLSEILTSGWADPEEWGVWSDSEAAHMSLLLNEIPSKDLSLNIEGRYFIGTSQDDLQVTLSANGKSIFQGTVQEGNAHNPSYTIPRDLFGNAAKLDLVFKFDKLDSPKDLGLSDDDRKLGISFTKLWITYPKE